MLGGAMAMAALYGVVQLHLLGSPTRTVHWRTSLLAMAAGAYGCGVASILLQWATTRGIGAFTDTSGREIVRVAGYTIDPFIEEFVKVAPIAIVAHWGRARWRWSLTDYVVLSAAIGSGFALLEAMMRFGATRTRVVDSANGWLIAVPSFSPPYIGYPSTIVRSWIPAPASGVRLMEWGDRLEVSDHIVWSAVAGLGLGLVFRLRGRIRWAGLLLVIYAGYTHAASNGAQVSDRAGALETVSIPADQLDRVSWLLPLAALLIAVVVDLRVLAARRGEHPELLVRGETASLFSGVLAVGRFGLVRPPLTAIVAGRFALSRRSTLYALDGGDPDGRRLWAETLATVHRVDAASDPARWRLRALFSRGGAATTSGGAARLGRIVRKGWPLALWLLLLAPSLLLFGSDPHPSGTVKGALTGAAYPLLIVTSGAGLAWVAWRLVSTLRALVGTRERPDHQVVGALILRAWTGAGALVFGAIVLRAIVGGEQPDQAFWSNSFHVLSALGSLLLVTGIAIVIFAAATFPPLTFVAVAGGGTLLIPTITFGFVAGVGLGGGLGLAGALLIEASRHEGWPRADDGPDLDPPPERPGIPATAVATAVVDAVGRVILNDSSSGGPTPPPAEMNLEELQYEDAKGDRRWKDTNQLVSDFPERPIYQDTDGTWRFGDSHQATNGFEPKSKAAKILRDDWGIDPERLRGDLHELEQVVANATNKPPGSGDGVGARGELAAIRDALAEGREVELIGNHPSKPTPDLKIDGIITEVKSREIPIKSYGWFKDRIKDAGDQIGKYRQGPGQVQLRLSEDALGELDFVEIDRQIMRTVTAADEADFVDQITVHGEGTGLLGRWSRRPDGRWTRSD